jgi:hypothetical protein
MVRKVVKRLLVLAGLGFAVNVWALKPEPADLLEPQWYLEAPTRMMLLGLAYLLPWLYRTRGEAGVKALQFVFYQVGVDRAPLLLKELRIDPHDARSLGRVLDFEDGLVGVRGVWTEECRGRAVKEERYCPGARELARCPQVCTNLMMAMEAGTFSIINPDLKAPEITKLLSTGDDCCLAVIEVPDAGDRAAELSPQADSAFPPVLKVPGLRVRLMATGMSSLAKALVKLATSGPEPMMWYEFFRYAPAECDK